MNTDKKHFAIFIVFTCIFLSSCAQQKWTPMCFGKSTSDGYVRYTPVEARAEKKKADLSTIDGQLRMGYVFGRGNRKPDWKEAAKWYRKAAEAGNGAAQGRLALLYEKGKGVKKDPVEAYFWFRAAGMKDCGGIESRKQKLSAEEVALVEKRLVEAGWDNRPLTPVYFDSLD